jgi:hypothetical protein
MAFVGGVWVLMMIIALVCMYKYGRNIPLAEEWWLVPPLTGHESNLLNWLWTQNNEHRVPLPRLVLLGLLKITNGDFRIGGFFNVAILGLLAFIMIFVARYIRGGRTSLVDAFFPLVLLHMGHSANLFMGWQIVQIIPTGIICAILLVLVRHPTIERTDVAIFAGACLISLPLCGANGLIFVPFLSLWLGYCGVLHWYTERKNGRRRWIGGFLIGSGVISLCLTGFYFVDYRYFTNPPSPSLFATVETGIKLLAYGFGPAANQWWTISTMAAVGLLMSSAVLAIMAVLRNKGLERHRALGLLLFLANTCMFVLATGWGRAALVPQWGLPLRYVIFAVPAFCTAFFLWEVYGPPQLRTGIQTALLLGMLFVLPFNIRQGLTFGGWYENGMNAVEQDILAGTRRSLLAERHREFLIHWDGRYDKPMLSQYMKMLHDAGIGPFAKMREDPAEAANAVENE